MVAAKKQLLFYKKVVSLQPISKWNHEALCLVLQLKTRETFKCYAREHDGFAHKRGLFAISRNKVFSGPSTEEVVYQCHTSFIE